MCKSEEHPQPADYRLLIEREWADVHQSRIQEWSALGVVVAVHLAVTQLSPANAARLGGWHFYFGIIFAVLGLFITLRHRHLMMTKLGWIFDAESELGLIRSPGEKPKHRLREVIEWPQKCKWLRPFRGQMPDPGAERKTSPNGILGISRPEIGWIVPGLHLAFPRFLSTSGLIAMIYLCLIAYDYFQIPGAPDESSTNIELRQSNEPMGIEDQGQE